MTYTPNIYPADGRLSQEVFRRIKTSIDYLAKRRGIGDNWGVTVKQGSDWVNVYLYSQGIMVGQTNHPTALTYYGDDAILVYTPELGVHYQPVVTRKTAGL